MRSRPDPAEGADIIHTLTASTGGTITMACKNERLLPWMSPWLAEIFLVNGRNIFLILIPCAQRGLLTQNLLFIGAMPQTP